MTKNHIKNTAASVRQRLLNKARETARPLNELLQYYVMERFLYRMGVVGLAMPVPNGFGGRPSFGHPL